MFVGPLRSTTTCAVRGRPSSRPDAGSPLGEFLDLSTESIAGPYALLPGVQPECVDISDVECFIEQGAVRGSPLISRPAQGDVRAVGSDARIVFANGVVDVARPSIVRGRSDHPRANRVELDVAIARQYVSGTANEGGLEASLP